ncbi:MAG: substrate-binding domain-containing protein [Sphaerochaetaceae bacterium]
MNMISHPLFMGNTQRIGFLAKNPLEGASTEMIHWLSVNLPENCSLITIAYQVKKPEYQKVLALLTKQNFDALILWGSVDSFLPVFQKATQENIVLLSIGSKHPDYPSLRFDSYSGMKAVVLHCIYTHNSKRIAFIRGPQEDVYAQERYQAYLDALTYAKIEQQPDLISPPVAWEEGYEGLERLYHRGLSPKEDYETIICAGDLLLNGVSLNLNRRGVHIPQDVKVIGFNDSRESRIFNPPCTTVRLPYREMSTAVFSMISELWDHKSVDDLSYPAQTIIRRSCSCSAKDTFGSTFRSSDAVINRIISLFHLDPQPGIALRESWNILLSYAHEQKVELLQQLEHSFLYCVETILLSGEDIELLHAGLLHCAQVSNPNLKALLGELLFPLISRAQEQLYIQTLEQASRQETLVSTLKASLKEVQSFSDMQSAMIAYLPRLGIEGCWVLSPLFDQSLYCVAGFDTSVMQDRQSTSIQMTHGLYSLKPSFGDGSITCYTICKQTTWNAPLLLTLHTHVQECFNQLNTIDMSNDGGVPKALLEIYTKLKHMDQKHFIQKKEQLLNELTNLQVTFQKQKTTHKLVALRKLCNTYKISLQAPKRLPLAWSSFEKVEALLDGVSQLVIAITPTSLRLEIKQNSTQNVLIHHLPLPTYADKPAPIIKEAHPAYIVSGKSASAYVQSLGGTIASSGESASAFVLAQEDCTDMQVLTQLMKILQEFRNLPLHLLVNGCENIEMLGEHLKRTCTGGTIYCYGSLPLIPLNLPCQTIATFTQLLSNVIDSPPSAICSDTLSAVEINDFRTLTKQETLPIIVYHTHWSAKEGETYFNLPNVLLCDVPLLMSPQFQRRLAGLIDTTSPLKPSASFHAKRIFFSLRKHAQTPVSRWQLAEELGLSEDYLTVLFKQEYGLTVSEYVNRYRIWYASSLLKTTSLPIALIAKMAGFNHSSYFCRIYRSLTGQSPHAYRTNKQ